MYCFKCKKFVETSYHRTTTAVDSGGPRRTGQYWKCRECGTVIMTD